MTLKETVADAAAEFVNGVLSAMRLSSRAEAEERDGEIVLDIEGQDSGAAIGYRGEVLDAIQFLTRTYINQEKNSSEEDCRRLRELPCKTP